jgi:1-acyl-sn-glycerol-3-phosphate acyltransferase
MKSPGLGRYFRRLGTISPSRENIQAAFEKGDDVILWPGGEVDAYRKWTKRDKAVLGDRKGFIRLAIRAGVPIVPVATVGGHDTLFVLSEGRGLVKLLKFKERLRSDVAPITLSLPFGVALHVTPFQHIPLPSKIRTELLEPVYLGAALPERLDAAGFAFLLVAVLVFATRDFAAVLIASLLFASIGTRQSEDRPACAGVRA